MTDKQAWGVWFEDGAWSEWVDNEYADKDSAVAGAKNLNTLLMTTKHTAMELGPCPTPQPATPTAAEAALESARHSAEGFSQRAADRRPTTPTEYREKWSSNPPGEAPIDLEEEQGEPTAPTDAAPGPGGVTLSEGLSRLSEADRQKVCDIIGPCDGVPNWNIPTPQPTTPTDADRAAAGIFLVSLNGYGRDCSHKRLEEDVERLAQILADGRAR